MKPTSADLARIRDLYTRGLYRQAFDAFAPFGALRSFTDTPARLLAGRLAMQVGAPRLGRKLHAAAFRNTPSNLEAVYYHARYRFERFGPYSALNFIRTQTDWGDASPDLRADWHAFGAYIAARLQDSDRADKLYEQALKLAPNRAWLRVEYAAILEARGATADALAEADAALSLLPWFRPALQAKAHLLMKSGSADAAIAMLTEAVEHVESGVLEAQLTAMLMDRGDDTAARIHLERSAALSPLLEKEGRTWLASRRADLAYRMGDIPAATDLARAVGEEFYTAFAERLGKPLTACARKVLPLELRPPGPERSIADLLAGWWKLPVPEALPQAQPPTDGLPDMFERRRFEDRGWTCVEFSMNFNAAAALIDAGVPIVVSLVEVGVTQHRLVIGYDRYRNTFFVVEGSDAVPSEAPADTLLERYATFGPRAMAVWPPSQKAAGERHRGQLPDATHFDRLYILQKHLADREFPKARSMYNAIRQDAPKHRLTKFAAVSWARGTGHAVLLFDAVTALANDYPDDVTFLLARAAAARDLGRLDERRALLETAAAAPDADALVLQSLAQVYMTDHRRQWDATLLLRRSLRLRPQAAAGYYLLGSQCWEQRRFTDTLELYRIACCLDDREEQFAEAFFRVSRVRDQVPEALRFFQMRASKAARPQVGAVKSLFQALVDRDETTAAFSMLDVAIEKLLALPDAPTTAMELRMFRVEMHAQFGNGEKAESELAALQSSAVPLEFHRLAAKIAKLKPDPAAALHHLKAALEIDPLWLEGQKNLLVLLMETEGRSTAVSAAQALSKKYPHHYGVHRLRVEFLTAFTDDDSALIATRDLLDLCSHDAWARRQLALILANRGQEVEAKAEIDRAGAIEPQHPSQYAVLAHVHRTDDRIEAALDTYRAAIRQNVDHEMAVTEFVHLSRGRAEKKAALRFIAEQLHAQPHNGDGLVAYRDQTLQLCASDDGADDNHKIIERLGENLDRILEDRPDLWQAWSMMIQQYGLTQRFEEATTLAREAAERFPLLAHVWADLARLYAVQEMDEERVDALRQAVDAAPGWSPAAMEFAEALSEAGEDDEAIAVLRRAVSRAPADPTAQVSLADRLWNRGDSEEAFARARRAVLLDPGFDPAWRMVMHWGERLERPEEALKLARELTRHRPGDARGWLKLARLLHEPAQLDEALKALETVIRLDPGNVEAHDQKSERLAEIGQFDDALAAAAPNTLAEDLPLVLKGRAAWVEAKRGNYAAAIPPMQRLVSEVPEYFWGWQQLAEWYNETGRNEGFLEASSQLVRLKPDHPMPFTFRGEAKLKTGDRDGGKNDLRDALRLAPQYAPAAAILFDACLADGEQRDARSALAVLQEHAAGVEVLAKQVQFACRTGDTEGAMRALHEIAETPGDHPPVALQIALSEISTAGWDDKAAKVLKGAWQSGGAFNPWAAVYWLDTPDGETSRFEDRLSAVDAVIRAYPAFAAAYDRKAEMLAVVGRADEALACCNPGPLQGKLPVTLRGRAAWIEARRGRRNQAIALMADAVRDDPTYLWGWRNLTQWYDAEGRHRDCVDAADRMVQLAPNDPLAYGYRGEARRLLGDRSGAKADFQKAFELDPAFDAAGLHLISEQLHARETEAAAHALSRLQEHAGGPLVKLRGVQVAVACGQLELARKRLRELAFDSSVPKSLLADGVEAFIEAGWVNEAVDELTAAVTGPDATPAAAGVWAGQLIAVGHGQRVLEQLPALFQRNAAAGREAALVYASATAQAGHTDAAAEAMHRFADHLRADDFAWSAAGTALSAAGQHALAVNWLSDWRTRESVEPAMLVPLTESLRAMERDAEAIEVARDAVELGGEPPAALVGWLALNDALAGNTADAALALDSIERIGLPDATRLVIALAEALVMVQKAGAGAKAAAFNEAREHIKVAIGACEPGERPAGIARHFRRVVARLATDTGTFSAKVWAGWQRFNPWIA